MVLFFLKKNKTDYGFKIKDYGLPSNLLKIDGNP